METEGQRLRVHPLLTADRLSYKLREQKNAIPLDGDSATIQNDMNHSRNGNSAVKTQSKCLGRSRSVSEFSWLQPHGDCFDLLKIYIGTPPWTRSATEA